MKAKDVMEPIIDTLLPDTPIKEAIKQMKMARRGQQRVGVKGMVVVDREGNLVGMFSIKDILKAIVPEYMKTSSLEEFSWEGMLEEMAKKVETLKVQDLMTKEVITVNEDDPLMEVASVIVKHNLQRVPVMGKEGKPVGIIYVRDLYYALVKALTGEEV
ncbi:MAG: CBS domain-containing protein [Nitrospirae bacterium]|nr:MAG: CBS domain-containing protein [Nitrospirota bacterium]